MHAPLQDAVEKLRLARAEREQADSVMDELEATFARTVEAERTRKIAAREAEAAAESVVKALAIAAYEADPSSKAVAEGVSIAVRTSYAYDAERAFAFAKSKDLAIVPESLDRKAFEKLLGALPALPEFVQKVETPSVRIAQSLTPVTVPVPVAATVIDVAGAVREHLSQERVA